MAKFCVHFSKNFRYLETVDQVIVPYRRDKHIIQELCRREKFTIVINILKDSEILQKDIKLWHNLYKKYKNVKIRIPHNLSAVWQKVAELGVPYFFAEAVTSLQMMEYIVGLRRPPCQVVLSGFLTYDFKRAAEYLHSHNINIRVIPNIAQIEAPSKEVEIGLKAFFVTPEMVPAYESYVDTFELYSDNMLQNNNVIYQIYAIDKVFHGPLNALIIGLKSTADAIFLGSLLLPKAACQYRCLLENKCHLCNYIEEYIDKAKDI